MIHEEASSGLRDHPEIVAYHPRAIIVLGRSADWPDEKLRALHGLNRRLSGVTVMTYDHLLGQGERLIAMLNQEDDALEEDMLPAELETGDDDLPF